MKEINRVLTGWFLYSAINICVLALLLLIQSCGENFERIDQERSMGNDLRDQRFCSCPIEKLDEIVNNIDKKTQQFLDTFALEGNAGLQTKAKKIADLSFRSEANYNIQKGLKITEEYVGDSDFSGNPLIVELAIVRNIYCSSIIYHCQQDETGLVGKELQEFKSYMLERLSFLEKEDTKQIKRMVTLKVIHGGYCKRILLNGTVYNEVSDESSTELKSYRLAIGSYQIKIEYHNGNIKEKKYISQMIQRLAIFLFKGTSSLTIVCFFLNASTLYGQTREDEILRPIIELRNLEIIPSTQVDLARYQIILEKLKIGLAEILVDEGFAIAPELDQEFQDRGVIPIVETRKTVIWGSLFLPDPLFGEIEYQLSLSINKYEQNVGRTFTVKINLGAIPGAIDRELRKKKSRFLKLFKDNFSTSDTSTRRFLRTIRRDGFDLSHTQDSYWLMIPDTTFYDRYGYNLDLIDGPIPFVGDMRDEAGRFLGRGIEKPIPVIGNTRIDLNSIFWGRKINWPYLDRLEVFPENNFNILIFPFDHYDNCDRDISKFCTKAVKELLTKEAYSTGINLNVKINNQFNKPGEPLDYETAKEIGQTCSADLVLWGDYEKQCEWDSTLVNIKFVPISSQIDIAIVGNRKETGFRKIDAISSLIYDNRLAGDIKDIIYFSLARASSDCLRKRELYEKLSVPQDRVEYVPVIRDLAFCAFRDSNFVEVGRLLKAGLAIDSINVSLLSAFARIYEDEDPSVALKFYRKIENYYPDRVSLVSHGNFYFKMNMLDEVEVMFKNYYAKDRKKDWLYYYALGITYSRMNRDDDAIIMLHKALEFQPNHLETYLKLVTLYKVVGNPKTAEATLSDAVHIDTSNFFGNTKALERRAIFHLGKNDTLKALKDYDLMLDHRRVRFHESSSQIRWMKRRRDLLFEKGQHSQAFKENSTLRNLHPVESNECDLWKARSLFKRGESHSSLKLFSDAINRHGEAELFMQRAIVHASIDKLDECKSDFQMAIKLDSSTYVYSLGQIAVYYTQPRFFDRDSALHYVNLALAREKWIKTRKVQDFEESKFYGFVHLFSVSYDRRIYKLHSHRVAKESINYISFMEETIETLLPKRYKFTYEAFADFAVSRVKFYMDAGQNNEAILFINKILDDRGPYLLNSKGKGLLNLYLAELYVKTKDFQLAIDSLDEYLFFHSTNKASKKNMIRIIKGVKTGTRFKTLQSHEGFVRIIEKYTPKVSKKS